MGNTIAVMAIAAEQTAGGDRSIRLLVVQNDWDKPLGRIGTGLEAAGVALDVRMSSRELPVVSGYDGLVVLPGLANPDDDDPAVHRARAAIGEAVERCLPVLGICLGGQLLAQVLGGETYRSRHELGYLEVESTSATSDDPLLRDAPSRFEVFHAHTCAFHPPPGAVVLLENEVCVQACRLGDAWAFQCHPEPTLAWIDALTRGIRGQAARIDPRTAAFFRGAGIDPEALEGNARRVNETAQRVALGIGRGFVDRCRAATVRLRVPCNASST